MYYTKAHSQNAVAKKQRLKMEAINSEWPIEPRRKIRVPRGRIRFTIIVKDHKLKDGMRLGLFELPWRGRFVSTDGQQLSAAKVCNGIATALNFQG